MNEGLANRIAQRLAEIEANGLTRKLVAPRGNDLSSNDYLALAKDARLKAAMIRAIEREGVGSTGSRLLRGERDCFAEVEKQFAAWKNAERALYFGSGYQANVGVLQTFLDAEDVIFSDELNHASLIDGIRLAKARKIIFRHLDVDDLERRLTATACAGQKFVVTESLFSMDGDIADLKKYAAVCRRADAHLIVDEAHAVGIYGARGSGLIEAFGVESDVFLSINAAGKALGAAGAFVAGSSAAIEYVVQKCRSFIFSTAPVPALADALAMALQIVANEPLRRQRLWAVSRFLRQTLNENGIRVPMSTAPIVPILLGDSSRAVRVAKNLQAKGFDVRAIRPPTVPERTARLRVSLNVGLSEEVLSNFVAALKDDLTDECVAAL
jgi:8-amino-7-oxononanoate synthase